MMEQITPKKSIKYLKKMGITSLQDEDESLMLALGGLKKGITPLEMAAAYATIANDGIYIEPTFYTKVENDKGKVVLKTKQKKKKVFSTEVACIMKQLLKQPVEGSNGTAKSCKIEGMDVAAKTGTTNNNYDKWLCGFTTYYTAVTWYGYDIGETVEYKGKSPAVVLWSTVMKNVHSGLAKTIFTDNSNVKKAMICPKTGKTATSNCSGAYTEYFLSGTVPDQCTSCIGGSKSNSQNSSNSNNQKQNTTKTTNTTKNETTATNITNTTKNNTTKNTTNDDASNTASKNKTDNSHTEEEQSSNNNSAEITNIPNAEPDENYNNSDNGSGNSDNNGNNHQEEAEDDEQDDGP